MKISTTFNLEKEFFSPVKKELLRHSGMVVYAFLYPTGVHGLEIHNSKGEFTFLPYQGQQIWKARFLGREITMKSMFDEPIKTDDFLNSYGGFLVHCGATAMGVPQGEDTHPQHGELPHAPYQRAYIEAGADTKGNFLVLGGTYNHRVAFSHNYVAHPRIKIYEDGTVFHMTMDIKNLRNQDMELMYLMHVNFRPIDGSNLYYSAKKEKARVRVFNETPDHFKTDGEMTRFHEFLNNLSENPFLHHEITPDKPFNPEVLFSIDYMADDGGYAHSIQENPDGFSQYISHRIRELDHGIRWISRTKEEDAMGIVLPATAEHKGYTREKAKGNLKTLRYHESIQFSSRAGLLDREGTRVVREKIESILK